MLLAVKVFVLISNFLDKTRFEKKEKKKKEEKNQQLILCG